MQLLVSKWIQRIANCYIFKGKINHYQLNENVVLKYLNDSPLFPKVKAWNLIWKLIHLRKLINKQKPDVVISFLARVNVASALAMIGIKSPLIICERTWPPFASLNNSLWVYIEFYSKGLRGL